MKSEKSGYVYLILSSDGLTKIGYSRNPSERLATLQTASHSRLTLLMTFESDDAPELEARLHEAFRVHRINGEWFNLSVCEIGKAVLMVRDVEDWLRRKSTRLFNEYEVSEIVKERLDRLNRKIARTQTLDTGGPQRGEM